jgi:hypothetical protein
MANYTNPIFNGILKEASIIVLDVMNTQTAFGITDEGERCFIPAKVVKTFGLEEGLETNAVMVCNTGDFKGDIPWRVIKTLSVGPQDQAVSLQKNLRQAMGDGDAPDLYSLRELSEAVGASEENVEKALKTMDNVETETMYYYET